MGNQSGQSRPLSSGAYNPDMRDWKPIGEGQTYTIWRNSITSEEVEEYLFTATDAKEFEYMRHVFQFRHNKENVVASKFFIEEKKAQICSTFYQGHVFNERIPLRLNEIKDIPFPDSLHLVNASLLGFNQLFDKVGSFSVTDHLIGVNSEAKVKVWVNSDFGKPTYEGGRHLKSDDQKIMVGEIIQVLDKIIDHRTEPESLTNFLSQGGPPTFQEALARLNQYTIRHRLSIPPILNSIAQLRDRGYFKKMHPKGTSLNNSVNLTQQRFSGFPPLGLAPQLPLSPPTGYDAEIPPVNEQIPFPGSEAYYEGGLPMPPFNPEGVNSMIPQIHPTNVVINKPIARTLPVGLPHAQLRAGINYPVRTLPYVKPVTALAPINSISVQPLSANIIPATSGNLLNKELFKPITSVPPPSLSSILNQYSSTPTYDSLIKNQTLYSHPVSSIPSKIELTVTKTTGAYSDNRIITNFSIIPSEYPSTSTLDSILFHTTELERTLEQASISNPKAVQKFTRQESGGSFSFGGYGTSTSRDIPRHSEWSSSEGHTDPNLLKGALALIGKIVDTQYNDYGSSRRHQDGFTNPDLLSKTKFYEAGSSSRYEDSGWGSGSNQVGQGTSSDFLAKMKNFKYDNLTVPDNKNNTSESFGSAKVESISSTNFQTNKPSTEASSPNIMAIVAGSIGSNKKISFVDDSVPRFGRDY